MLSLRTLVCTQFFSTSNRPRVWQHLICTKLHEVSLRGNLPKVFQNFLHDRTTRISVRVQNKLSSAHSIRIGVPQGQVLSVLLFLLAINDLPLQIKSPLTQPFFADDYNISLQSSCPSRAHRLLQSSLNSISTWASNHGFRFSPEKTHLVIFRKRNPISSLPPLILQNFKIQMETSTKFLGLLFDQKLTWTPHIKYLKAKALRSINVLKYLSPKNRLQ